MLDERQDLSRLLEHQEREFLLGKVRVSVLSSVENLDVGDYRIDQLRGGETTELPRWVAEELAVLKLVEVPAEPFEDELSKALSREKMMGPLQLSVLSPDFYVKLRRRVSTLATAVKEGRAKKEEYERTRSACYDLVGIRLSKLLSLSSSSVNPIDLGERLSPEERTFFLDARGLSSAWKSGLLGEAK